MREIKFRIWDKWLELMMPVIEISWNSEGNINNVVAYEEFDNITYEYGVADIKDRLVIMKYTGLKDRNDTEIYESDIFKTGYHDDTVAVVEWKDDARFLGITIESERKIVYVGREPRVKVIGNIYENPELLEGAK